MTDLEKRQEDIKSIKEFGQSVIDNADRIRSLVSYSCLGDEGNSRIEAFMFGDVHERIGLAQCLKYDVDDNFEREWYPKNSKFYKEQL